MKNKVKSSKISSVLIAIIFVITLLCTFFTGCIKGAVKFIDLRANWVYESEDMTLIISTPGDSYFYLVGKIIKGDKTTNLLIDVDYDIYKSSGKLSVYKDDGIDIYSETKWIYDRFLFSCSYDKDKEKLILSKFIWPKTDGSAGFEREDTKIVLLKQDYTL